MVPERAAQTNPYEHDRGQPDAAVEEGGGGEAKAFDHRPGRNRRLCIYDAHRLHIMLALWHPLQVCAIRLTLTDSHTRLSHATKRA